MSSSLCFLFCLWALPSSFEHGGHKDILEQIVLLCVYRLLDDCVIRCFKSWVQKLCHRMIEKWEIPEGQRRVESHDHPAAFSAQCSAIRSRFSSPISTMSSSISSSSWAEHLQNLRKLTTSAQLLSSSAFEVQSSTFASTCSVQPSWHVCEAKLPPTRCLPLARPLKTCY